MDYSKSIRTFEECLSLEGKTIEHKVWDILPDNCKHFMKNIKSSFLKEVTTDVDDLTGKDVLLKIHDNLDRLEYYAAKKTSKLPLLNAIDSQFIIATVNILQEKIKEFIIMES